MRSLAAVLATVLAVGLTGAAGDPESGSRRAEAQQDEKAIRALLAGLEKDWNAHDMKSFSARLAEDADVVNRFGLWVSGRPAIERHLTELHASSYRGHLVNRSSKVEQVRFITPDVAVVHERIREEAGRSVRTYVLQKRDGRWWVQTANIAQEGAPPPG